MRDRRARWCCVVRIAVCPFTCGCSSVPVHRVQHLRFVFARVVVVLPQCVLLSLLLLLLLMLLLLLLLLLLLVALLPDFRFKFAYWLLSRTVAPQ